METMSAGRHFFLQWCAQKVELMYKGVRVSGGIPRFGKLKFNSRPNNTGPSVANSGGGFVKREPVNGVNNQVLDKCHNCGILLKPNHRDHCKARSFVCHNCNCRGPFARFC